jgi:hypothetical protein
VPRRVGGREDRVRRVRARRVRAAAAVEVLVEVEALRVEDVVLLELLERDRVGPRERPQLVVRSELAVADRRRVRPNLESI